MRGQANRAIQTTAKAKGWDPTEIIEATNGFDNMDEVKNPPGDGLPKVGDMSIPKSPTPHNEGPKPKKHNPFPGIPM